MSNKSLRLGLARRVLNESSEISLSARLVSHARGVAVSLTRNLAHLRLRAVKVQRGYESALPQAGKVHLVVIAQL